MHQKFLSWGRGSTAKTLTSKILQSCGVLFEVHGVLVEIEQKAGQKISFASQMPAGIWKGSPASFKNFQKERD